MNIRKLILDKVAKQMEITVKLYETGLSSFISRSQARRVVSGSEQFKFLKITKS